MLSAACSKSISVSHINVFHLIGLWHLSLDPAMLVSPDVTTPPSTLTYVLHTKK